MTVALAPDELIADWAANHEPGCVLAVEAHRLVSLLRQADPVTLASWLDARAETIVARDMRSLLASERGLDRHRRRGRVFTKFLEQQGENELTWPEYCVSPANEWKPMGLMERDEVWFVYTEYRGRAKANALEAALFKAIHGKMKPGQIVSDVFTPQQILALMGRP